MKLLIYTCLVIALFGGSLAADDLASVLEEFQSSQIDQATDLATHGTATMTDFILTAGDSTVNARTDYTLTFVISSSDIRRLWLSGFLFLFPDEYDLSDAAIIGLDDDVPCYSYNIYKREITDNLVRIDIYPWWDDKCAADPTSITFTVSMSGITNPEPAGEYDVVGLAFNKYTNLLAGPARSEPLSIRAGSLVGLQVSPPGDLDLTAGDMVEFSAVGVDAYGNAVADVQAAWSLDPDGAAIGTLSGSTLLATTVGSGSVLAEAEGYTASSGLITVTAGPLARLELDINPEQFVRVPLQAPAMISLYDNFGNLVDDYDLSAAPIRFEAGGNGFDPEFLDNNDYFQNGVIDLAGLPVEYRGPSAYTDMTVSTAGITSDPRRVSFNGYDIFEVLDASGRPLTSVPENTPVEIGVVVQNNGLRSPYLPVQLTTGYEGSVGSAEASFTGRSGGAVDTISMTLPAHSPDPAEDILTVRIRAQFDAGNPMAVVEESVALPIAILPVAEVSLVTTDVGPDTLYPGAPFELSATFDLGRPVTAIDAAYMKISVVPDGGTDGRVVYDGSPAGLIIEDSLLSFENLPGILPEAQAAPSGPFLFYVELDLTADGERYMTAVTANAAEILPPVILAYVTESLTPRTVAAGYQTSFEFVVNLGNEYAVGLDWQQSRVEITGADYTASSSLILADSVLQPGENTIRTQPIFIPITQLDHFLQLAATLRLTVLSVGFDVVEEIDFDFETVRVIDQPVARIIDLEILAPNAPTVNTSQPFQARAIVANLSSSDLGPLTLGLTSDGESEFDSLVTTGVILPRDTVEILFDCVAADQPARAEIFRVAIESAEYQTLSPLNNIALISIEEPARLEFDYTLFGAPGGLIDQNTGFGLRVELVNRGEAEAGDGAYLLTTGGVEFGTADSLAGPVTVDRSLEFSFISPGFDTTVEFIFQLTEVPVDLNTGEPAIITDSSFSFDFRVESQDADLLVEATPLGSNLVSPGQSKDLFQLSLTNRGVSSLTMISLDNFAIVFRGRDNLPLPTYTIIDASATVLSEDGASIAAMVHATDKLSFTLTDFLIGAGETRTLLLTAGFDKALSDEFTLIFETGDIDAVFSGGSQDGRPVRVSSADGSSSLISRVYVTRGAGLEESFVIENNPFNPLEQPARFSFELSQSSTVEFRVFTLTGEEVYSVDLPGQLSASVAAEQEIQWDGRNNSGRTVANGIYIVSIKVVETGEQTRMKVAVVK